MLEGFYLKGTFGLLFFAVVRFSPPSQEDEAVKRKAKARNNSPDSQEPTFNSFGCGRWAKPEAAPRPLWLIRNEKTKPISYLVARIS